MNQVREKLDSPLRDSHFLMYSKVEVLMYIQGMAS